MNVNTLVLEKEMEDLEEQHPTANRMREYSTETFREQSMADFKGYKDNLSDHDLLIRLSTLLEVVQLDMRDLKNQTVVDFERRIRLLEKGYWKAVGVIAGVTFIGELITRWLFK